jgi:ornithine cyclodeaminase
LADVRALTDVRVWSPQERSRARFVSEMSAQVAAPLLATASAEEAVRDADLVVLATSSSTPVVMDGWVTPGAHVVSVGACRPDQREMDPALVARARVYVDSRAAALVESGDIVLGMRERRFSSDHVRGELGEVVLGRAAGRETDDEVTIFKSLGMAVEDVTAADLVFRRAIETGAGTELAL